MMNPDRYPVCFFPVDFITLSRSGVKQMRCFLEIANVQFGVYNKSRICTLLEHVVLSFLNFSLSDAGKQLCSAVFFRNIWA